MGSLSRSGPSYYVHLFFLQTLPVQPWIKKKLKPKLKPFKYTSSYTKVVTFVEEYTDDSLCQMLLRDLNNWSKNISMVYYLSSIASETSAYNVMLI